MKFQRAVEVDSFLVSQPNCSEPSMVGLAGSGEAGLFVAVGAQIQHVQLDQVAEGQVAVDVALLGQRGGADRQPLQVGLHGGVAASDEVALLVCLVVLRAVGPVIVGDLVVIPGDDPRARSVRGLQVRVGVVLSIALAVVGQGDDLVGRLVQADGAGLTGVLAARVLVDVVADVQRVVDVAAVRHIAVGAEEAGLPVGAAKQREAQFGDVGALGRCGAGLADRGGLALAGAVDGGEAVEVAGVGLQAAGLYLHGHVAGRLRLRGAGGDDLGELFVAGDFPLHVGGLALAVTRVVVFVGGHAGPQQHAIRVGVTGGNAMLEGILAHLLVDGRVRLLGGAQRRGRGGGVGGNGADADGSCAGRAGL